MLDAILSLFEKSYERLQMLGTGNFFHCRAFLLIRIMCAHQHRSPKKAGVAKVEVLPVLSVPSQNSGQASF
jgi:hypothetical protein